MDSTDRFARLVQGPEGTLPLDEAALLVAAHAYPDLDVDEHLRRIDDLAAGCSEPTLEGWRRHLFEDLGFTGATRRYYDPANSYLNDVVDRRRGMPIALSVLGMEVGRRLGVRLAGIGMPGHFLLLHDTGSRGPADLFVDPFHGGAVLDRRGCNERFVEINGPRAPFLASYLEVVGPRAILMRMLTNLKSVFVRRGDLAGLRWVVELRLAIPGTPMVEHRDRALVMGALGRFDDAADELESLAEIIPDSAPELLAEAVAFRSRLN
ncbi:MAG: hypothetical protein QOD63_2016 [Actinomycetota bacterium]|nr:hypothetical protein [Actinomycetota bacterium]